MSFSANELVALLGEQAGLLEQLIAYGESQRQAIEAGRISELIAILGQKQPQLERLTQIRQRLNAERSVIENCSFWTNSTAQQRCQKLRDLASEGFERLIELENVCEYELSQSRNQIQQRLQNVESGRAAADAYQRQICANPPDRIDFSSVG